MRLILGILLIFIIIFQTSLMFFDINLTAAKPPPLKVGLVFSTTGWRTYKEYPVQEATLMAIQEINKRGGVLGRQIIPVVKNGDSNWTKTIKEMENLILEDKVVAIFGAWMPTNRTILKEIMEKYDNLLVSPYQYEGIVKSAHTIFVGTTAHQQIPSTIDYSFKHFGKSFFLVGTDYIFSNIMHIMARDHIQANNGKVVGEVYIPFGESPQEAVQKIIKTKPDVIINTIMGDDNVPFFRDLKKEGISAPVFSFSITEANLSEIKNIDNFVGTYATWNYFQSIDNNINKEFVKNLLKFSNVKAIDNAAEAGYVSVYMWAQAVEQTGKLDVESLSRAFSNMMFNAPEGPVTLDTIGRHAWKYSRIGKIRPDGQFDIIWTSPNPIRPIPNQIYRSNEEWESILQSLQRSKGNISAIESAHYTEKADAE